MSDLALQCRQQDFDAAEMPRYQALRVKLKAGTHGVRELPDGYALRLAAEAALFREAAEWISLERRCCPFLTLGLEWAEDGVVWLRLTGGPGVKAFLSERLAAAPAA